MKKLTICIASRSCWQEEMVDHLYGLSELKDGAEF